MPHDLRPTGSAQPVPLTEQLFATFCHATPAEARELSLRLSQATRAQLALFCNARIHLRPIGRAIASACSEASLIEEAGAAGRTLFMQAQLALAKASVPAHGSGRRIALAVSVSSGRHAHAAAFSEDAELEAEVFS